jgi:hypothetical protein
MGFMAYQLCFYQLNLSAKLVASFERVSPPIAYNLPSKPKQHPGSTLANYIEGILLGTSSLLLILYF